MRYHEDLHKISFLKADAAIRLNQRENQSWTILIFKNLYKLFPNIRYLNIRKIGKYRKLSTTTTWWQHR